MGASPTAVKGKWLAVWMGANKKPGGTREDEGKAMSTLRLKIPWLGFGNKKARGVNLRLEFFDTASAYNIGTISDLHEIYAFQSSFARLMS